MCVDWYVVYVKMILYMSEYDVFDDFRNDGGERDEAIIGWVSTVSCFGNRDDVSTKPVGWERRCS